MNENDPAEIDADEALVERARGGDQGAYAILVERHLGRVWNLVWKIVHHDEDAEDVAQEVFLVAWQSLRQFRGEARFTTWLHTIAVTRALNFRERASEKVRRASGPLMPESDEPGSQEILPEVEAAAAATRAASPLEMLEAAELRRRLADCLKRLPSAWSAVLALRDTEERSYEEISRILGLAIGTVRSRLARSRLSLKQCIEGHAS